MKIEQRIGRIHRIGQEKEVTIYNLCATGSAEDYTRSATRNVLYAKNDFMKILD